VREHLREPAQKSRDRLMNTIADLKRRNAAEPDCLAALANAATEIDVEARIDERLSRFIEAAGAEVVPSRFADAGALTSMYFAEKPPFAHGEKKAEFPDAIALLSLLRWAETKEARVLLVSRDGGWQQFARANSGRFEITDDLAEALAAAQEDDGHALAKVRTILRDKPEVLNAVIKAAIDGMVEIQPKPEAHASMLYEVGDAEFIPEIALITDEDDIAIINNTSTEIVCRIPVMVVGRATASFAFYFWDSVDREYVGMGDREATIEFEENAAVLLTLGVSPEMADDITVNGAEFIDASGYIDFGDISPDYGDDFDDRVDD